MIAAESSSTLVAQVLASENRQLRILAARGLLPLPVDELVPLQVRLAQDSDPEVAGRAVAMLKITEPRHLANFVAAEAGPAELAFVSAEIDHPAVLEALLRRRDVPRYLLVDIASRLAPALQEILILRQDAIVEEPAILDALEVNPQLEYNVRRRIGEYREHLLHRDRTVDPVEQRSVVEATEEEVRLALAEAAQRPGRGEQDESTGLSEAQIRSLPVPVRLKLSRGAARTLRSILVKDSNPLVAVSTLVNNALSDDEVEQLARSRSVIDDVLLEITRHREWMNRYGILNALLNNPRTPIKISVRFIARLGIRDLRSLGANRNVSDAVRSAARRQYQNRTA